MLGTKGPLFLHPLSQLLQICYRMATRQLFSLTTSSGRRRHLDLGCVFLHYNDILLTFSKITEVSIPSWTCIQPNERNSTIHIATALTTAGPIPVSHPYDLSSIISALQTVWPLGKRGLKESTARWRPCESLKWSQLLWPIKITSEIYWPGIQFADRPTTCLLHMKPKWQTVSAAPNSYLQFA